MFPQQCENAKENQKSEMPREKDATISLKTKHKATNWSDVTQRTSRQNTGYSMRWPKIRRHQEKDIDSFFSWSLRPTSVGNRKREREREREREHRRREKNIKTKK